MASYMTLYDVKAGGFRLVAHCGDRNCGHAMELDVDRLIERFGADYIFTSETKIRGRLRCSVCRHRGGVIHLLPGHTGPSWAEPSPE